MTNHEAIEELRKHYPKRCKMVDGRMQGGFDDTESKFGKALTMAIEALEMQERYEAQYLDDMRNPLEPLKITSALNSEILKFEYRKEHRPKDISILDYTIIAALKECLERRTEVKCDSR